MHLLIQMANMEIILDLIALMFKMDISDVIIDNNSQSGNTLLHWCSKWTCVFFYSNVQRDNKLNIKENRKNNSIIICCTFTFFLQENKNDKVSRIKHSMLFTNVGPANKKQVRQSFINFCKRPCPYLCIMSKPYFFRYY